MRECVHVCVCVYVHVCVQALQLKWASINTCA